MPLPYAFPLSLGGVALIKNFGVTATTIRDHHFPQLAPFSTASKPTATVPTT